MEGLEIVEVIDGWQYHSVFKMDTRDKWEVHDTIMKMLSMGRSENEIAENGETCPNP